MTPLLRPLEELAERWRNATKAISADGAMRPLEWEGKDILRVCADDLERVLRESGLQELLAFVEDRIKNWEGTEQRELAAKFAALAKVKGKSA